MLKDDVRKVKEDIIYNANKVDNGGFIGLPWYHIFPRLGEYLPVIPKATSIMFTAGSGIGKSHSWVGMVLFSHYKLKQLFPNNNYKVKFLIALLEDPKDMLISRLFCMILYDKFNIRVDVLTLKSMRKNKLSKEIQDKLDLVEIEIVSLLEDCEIIDSTYNPTGIFKWVRSESNKLGTHHNKSMLFSKEDGSTYNQDVYSHYELNDPDLQVIVIVDNLNNLQTESKDGRLLSRQESIGRWTSEYARLQITKHYKFTVINILQQSADSEKPQYDYKGELIIDRVKPSLDGLGNNKESQRDHIIIIGIFAPDRFGISQYPENSGYNISVLKDAYRSIIILKSNISECNKEIPFYFDGACSRFDELPLPNQLGVDLYRAIKERKVLPGLKIK
ncbi:MAG: hypothetical protein ACRCXT_09215 [Paraclostridium sp.]